MKKALKTGLTALVILFTISCKKEAVSTIVPVSIKTEENAAQMTSAHYIGERFGGGVIFWIDSTSEHGLIADTVDLPLARWWNGTSIETGAEAIRISAGKGNTRKIVLSQGRPGHYAALECVRSTRSGYEDWFLPSLNELNELYKQKTIIGGFSEYGYWSSSEYGFNVAWLLDFSSGTRNNTGKALLYGVRAVRAF